jgi:hypothetical protein
MLERKLEKNSLWIAKNELKLGEEKQKEIKVMHDHYLFIVSMVENSSLTNN